MGLVLATTVGMVIMVTLWSLGAKALDASFILIALVLIAAVARMVAPFLPGNKER